MSRIAAGRRPFRREYGEALPFEDPRVQQLDGKLWHGYAGLAVSELEALRIGRRFHRRRAAEAALALCRYYAANEQYNQALDCLIFARTRSRALGRDKRAQLMEIHSLLGLNRTAEARDVAERSLRRGDPDDGCLNAALASVYVTEAHRRVVSPREAAERYLACVNRPLKKAGFVGLALRDTNRPLALDNLASEIQPPIPASMPAKVSVFMAVYNGRDNIEYAVRSVLEQTWSNLELVIVDDASTDDSWSIIRRLAKEDERIVSVRQSVNGGAYVARNAALARATGDFVVTNDADDWAHPQKIEAQVRRLLEDDAAPGNLTFRVRVTRDMMAQPRLNSAHVPMIHNDYSALMLRREKVLEMGGWDAVRVSADAEFVARSRAIEGNTAVSEIYAGVPLSLSLFAKNNLTAASATSIWTYHFGSRHEYVRQYREWHRSGENLKTKRTSQVTPFPVPAICYYRQGHEQNFDVVLVSDFGLHGEEMRCNSYNIQQLREQGLEVAILPWPDYKSLCACSVNDKISRLCRESGVVTLVHGEKADCNLLLISHPEAMMHKLVKLPEVDAKRVVILAGEASKTSERETVQQTVAWAFGKCGEWVSASEFSALIEKPPTRR